MECVTFPRIITKLFLQEFSCKDYRYLHAKHLKIFKTVGKTLRQNLKEEPFERRL